jgi:uncharacterized protein with von Willebrand factor type A (vWA) domain
MMKNQLHHVNSRVAEVKKGFVTVISKATNGKGEALAIQVLQDTANALLFLKKQFNQKQTQLTKSEQEEMRRKAQESISQKRYNLDAQVYLKKFQQGTPKYSELRKHREDNEFFQFPMMR